MQTHTEKTFWLLSHAFKHGDIPNIAASHHERWDGTGYPWGLKDHKIPKLTRITTIADVWSAITNKRVYQHNVFSFTECVAVMRTLRGTICDPDLLDQFLFIVQKKYV